MIPLEGSNLAGGWATIWSAITSAWPGVNTMLNLIAAALVTFALAKFFWQKRKGLQGGRTDELWGTLLVAAVIGLPGVFLPILLTIADKLIDFLSRVVQGLH